MSSCTQGLNSCMLGSAMEGNSVVYANTSQRILSNCKTAKLNEAYQRVQTWGAVHTQYFRDLDIRRMACSMRDYAMQHVADNTSC